MEGNIDHSTIDVGGEEAVYCVINAGSPRLIWSRVDSHDQKGDIICPRVDKKIKDVDLGAYEPQLISFGPYHYRKISNFEKMERVKELYKQDLLDRFEIQLEIQFEGDEASFFSEMITHDAMKSGDGGRRYSKEQMMNDGCFIVELFFKFNDLFKRGVAIDEAEEASNSDQVGYRDLPFKKLTQITNDILLLENQLPFIILETIYNKCKTNARDGFLHPDSFKDLTVIYFQSFISVYSPPGKDFDHLLHLFHTCLIEEVTKKSIPRTSWLSRAFGTTPKDDYNFKVEAYRMELRNALRTEKSHERRQLIHSATELSICGVKFKRFRKVFSTTVMGNFMNVDFKGGVVKIAALRGPTFRVLRNLMAMEHIAGRKYGSDVTIYGYFISGLVESCEDVELLKKQNILVDWREKEAEVAVKLQSLCKGIDVGKMESRLWDVMLRILAHCEGPETNFNARMHAFFFNPWEKLMVDYFGSPWKALATIGGTIVVGLTIVQTTLSIIQFKHH